MWYTFCIVTLTFLPDVNSEVSFDFNYPNIKDEVYEQPIEMMSSKIPHKKNSELPIPSEENAWAPFDFSKFDNFLSSAQEASSNNRVKRRAKRRRGHGARRRNKMHVSTSAPEEIKNVTSTALPIARRADLWETQQVKTERKKGKKKPIYDLYEPPVKQCEYERRHVELQSHLRLVTDIVLDTSNEQAVYFMAMESAFVEMPKDLYQAHLRPGVIFRIHMSEAILKMQYRNYGEDKDESVIEADVEYLRLTRKVINDEITKFEDLKWLVGWFSNRSELIQEHMCNTRYYAVGIPPTMFTHTEEYMKRMCLFDNVYIDHIPYVIGEDGSLMAAVAPPVLHCDAATCTSVPFIDSIMFDERYARTNVRTVTRCQASCRARCRNDADCLKRCTDRCFRSD